MSAIAEVTLTEADFRILGLRSRHFELFEAIRDYWREFEYGPSMADLMLICDISSSSVASYRLTRLREAGLLIGEPNAARTHRLAARFRTHPNE